MKTTIKTLENLAAISGFTIDRPATECINVRGNSKSVMYTGTSTQEVYAWLQGFRFAMLTAREHVSSAERVHGRTGAIIQLQAVLDY